MNSVKVCINTLSPINLISPRFFECMAAKSVILCEKSGYYNNIINKKYLIEFNQTLSDFNEKFSEALIKSKDDNFLVEAQKYVKQNHTWKIRVNSFVENVLKI